MSVATAGEILEEMMPKTGAINKEVPCKTPFSRMTIGLAELGPGDWERYEETQTSRRAVLIMETERETMEFKYERKMFLSFLVALNVTMMISLMPSREEEKVTVDGGRSTKK